MPTIIRDAQPEDFDAISRIYAHEVLHGHASFELEPPTSGEMRTRGQNLIDNGFPYLVSETDQTVSGYAYFGPFRPRPAYQWTVENSVYVSREYHGMGIGKQLLQRLIFLADTAGFRQMMAIVGDQENHASIGLHRACGFEQIGIQKKVGWKHNMWIDCVMLQRSLGPGSKTPPNPVQPADQLG